VVGVSAAPIFEAQNTWK